MSLALALKIINQIANVLKTTETIVTALKIEKTEEEQPAKPPVKTEKE